MLVGVFLENGVLSISACRDWYNHSIDRMEGCLEYLRAHFFCLESSEYCLPEYLNAEPTTIGQYLSPDGKMRVEIHPMSIQVFVYPLTIPSWC